MVVTAQGVGWDGVIGIQWMEAKDVTKHPTMAIQPPTTEIILSKISVVPRLRNPSVGAKSLIYVVSLTESHSLTGELVHIT